MKLPIGWVSSERGTVATMHRWRVVLGLVLAFFFVGCGGAQRSLSIQARVMRASQAARVDYYDAMDSHCFEVEPTIEEYRECMLPARAVAIAADAYVRALEEAQAYVSAGDTLDPARLIGAAFELARLLRGAGLPVPDAVADLAELFSRPDAGADAGPDAGQDAGTR